MVFGVTPTGFSKKNLTDLLTEIQDQERTDIDPALNLLATSVFGQINGIFADQLRELWDVAEAVYRSQFPDSASEEAFDGVASITGATRLPPTNSTVTLTVNLNPGTTLTIGRVVSVVGVGDRFATTEEVTNSGGVPADFPVEAESEELGAIAAPAGTLTVIETPVTGWNSVTNALDADPGREIETDADFRIRREELIRIGGTATLEAIRSAVRDVEDVIQVFVIENVTDFTDINNLPPHSFETIVSGGTDADIAETIFLSKPAGIRTFGDESEIVADSQGVNHTIEFSRPEDVPIYVDLTVVTDPVTFPIDGSDQIKAAIVAKGDTLDIGEDVIALVFKCEPLDVTGVIDVTVFKIDTITPPVNTGNIVIAFRDLARFDTSRITVTVT